MMMMMGGGCPGRSGAEVFKEVPHGTVLREEESRAETRSGYGPSRGQGVLTNAPRPLMA